MLLLYLAVVNTTNTSLSLLVGSTVTCLFIDFNLFAVRRHPSERTTSASRSSRTGKRQSQAHEKRRRDTLMLLF